MGNLAVVFRLDPLIPYMPVPCLPVLVKNQRRMSMLDLGLDHSLGVWEVLRGRLESSQAHVGQSRPVRVGTVGMMGEASPL